LLTNNPQKVSGLERYGINVVERVPLEVPPRPTNIEYLRAKQEKLGHLLTGLHSRT
jgi:3,4-dihydroxy 2-butanone 4-phosphate synthase/GTP cyclohydrolase II